MSAGLPNSGPLRPEDLRLLSQLQVLDAVTPIQVDCMFCGVVMSPGRSPVSHGVCTDCRPRVRELMRRPAR